MVEQLLEGNQTDLSENIGIPGLPKQMLYLFMITSECLTWQSEVGLQEAKVEAFYSLLSIHIYLITFWIYHEINF